MIFIKDLTKVTDGKYMVGYIHFRPFDSVYGLGKSKEQLEQEGMLVDSIPEPEQIEGKQAILYCNPQTKEFWYEYVDIPKSPEEMQQEQIEAIKQAIAELSTMIIMLQTPQT